MAAGFDLRPAWRLDDRRIEEDAVAFWRRLDILPPDVAPEQRARELVAVAYKNGRIVGVTTAALGRLEIVRARLAMLRGAVDPDHRRGRVGSALLIYTRELIERWSMDHPDERVAGLGAIIESPDLIARQKEPFWPMTRFGIVGYMPDGRQIRVSWFEDFRLD
jgi:GNAT superfamily N-acetyltransferase